jgi:hypothetical protein
MLDQQLLFLGRADKLRAVVALELVHQPGADRIHPLDLGEVDGQIVGRERLQLLIELADPEHGQVAAEAQHAAAVLECFGEVLCDSHRR